MRPVREEKRFVLAFITTGQQEVNNNLNGQT